MKLNDLSDGDLNKLYEKTQKEEKIKQQKQEIGESNNIDVAYWSDLEE